MRYYMQVGSRKYYYDAFEDAEKVASEIFDKTGVVMGIMEAPAKKKAMGRKKASPLPKAERPANYYHQRLIELGQKIVEDCVVMFSHLYIFDCGCVRTYQVSPITFQESEELKPCKRHKNL